MSSYDFGEDFASAATRLAHDENYLAHYGVKGMKWGIRRYQNEDGTLTPAGKERYRSTFDGGTSKVAEEFYRKAVAKSSNENWLDLRSSLPVQHAVAKVRQDYEKYYDFQKFRDNKFQDVLLDEYRKIPKEEKDKYTEDAIKRALDDEECNTRDEAQQLVTSTNKRVDDNAVGYTITEYELNHPASLRYSAISGYFQKNMDKIGNMVKDLDSECNRLYGKALDGSEQYIKEFTKGFGQYELKDLSKKYGTPYTVDNKLSAIIRDLSIDYSVGLAAYKPDISNEKDYTRLVANANKKFNKMRREAFQKNPGNTKLY